MSISAPLADADVRVAASAVPVAELLGRARAFVSPALEEVVCRLSPELRAAVRHHLDGGGKYVRAALVLLSAAAAGDGELSGVPGAVAVELVHNFSLIHDDIIDGDLERRHRPTLWSELGIGHAIIAGDALAVLALQVLLEEPTTERVRAASTLATATQAMIAGQALDMAWEQRPSISVEACLEMEAGKTGALLSCAASIGAVLAGAGEATVEALATFGSHLGIAFQAVDDVLGIWGDPSVTGKPVGNDLRQHKKTLPVAIAVSPSSEVGERLISLLANELSDLDVATAVRLLEESGAREQTMAIGESHLQKAYEALERVPLEPGPRAELAAIARYVAARDR